MRRVPKARILISLILFVAVAAISSIQQPAPIVVAPTPSFVNEDSIAAQPIAQQLATLEVKGRAPKTGYTRTQFGTGWASVNGCDMRNIILARDLTEVKTNSVCQVVRGVLHDPYTATEVVFVRGQATSADVQIDHVVALSNAWQTGAQQLTQAEREQLANDPLELLAVAGVANQQKSDGDAATWLPKNKDFRCTYVSRQVEVKKKYKLWVTPAEKASIEQVLRSC